MLGKLINESVVGGYAYIKIEHSVRIFKTSSCGKLLLVQVLQRALVPPVAGGNVWTFSQLLHDIAGPEGRLDLCADCLKQRGKDKASAFSSAL